MRLVAAGTLVAAIGFVAHSPHSWPHSPLAPQTVVPLAAAGRHAPAHTKGHSAARRIGASTSDEVAVEYPGWIA